MSPSTHPRHEMLPTLVNLSGIDEPSSQPYVEVIVWFTSFLNLTKQATGCDDCAPVSWFSDIMVGVYLISSSPCSLLTMVFYAWLPLTKEVP